MVGFLVFCPPQFWRTLGILYLGLVIGTLTLVSVPNMYHSLGREGVKEEALKEEAWHEAMQARRDAEAARAAAAKARDAENWRKAKAEYDAFGGQPGCGYKAIAKKNNIYPVRLHRYSRGEYQEGLSDAYVDGSSGDDSGDYDSDRTF